MALDMVTEVHDTSGAVTEIEVFQGKVFVDYLVTVPSLVYTPDQARHFAAVLILAAEEADNHNGQGVQA